MKKIFLAFLALFFVLSLTNCKKDISVTGVTVNPTTATLDIGKTLQLDYAITPKDAVEQTVTWSSDNTTVASVNVNNGLVTSISAGTAKITATTKDGGYTASCAVTVVPDPVSVTGITVNPSTATLILNKTLQLNYVITPSNADVQTVTWSSDNTSVATVSSGGLITAISEGTTEITVTTSDGSYTAFCTVTVQIDLNWLTNYNIVKDGPNWGAERSAFDDAFNQYKAVYGIMDYANSDATDREYMGGVTLKQFMELVALYPDPNYRKMVLAQLPVNFLYYMQKTAIEEYIDFVTMVKAEFPTSNWDLATIEIMDMTGGVHFNPSNIVGAVLSSAPNLMTLVNLIESIATTADLISVFNATTPAYYDVTLGYLGFNIYGQGPFMQKYDYSRLEGIVWFLAYFLLESLSPPTDFFHLPFTDAKTSLCDLFLGTHAADYPFYYDYTLASPVSSTTLTSNHRFFLTDGLAFNPSADVNSLPSSSVLWSLLAAENNLRLKWHDWGTALKNLNDIEETLYAPNHKIWNAANHTWPSVPVLGIAPLWITELPSGPEAVGIPK